MFVEEESDLTVLLFLYAFVVDLRLRMFSLGFHSMNYRLFLGGNCGFALNDYTVSIPEHDSLVFYVLFLLYRE